MMPEQLLIGCSRYFAAIRGVAGAAAIAVLCGLSPAQAQQTGMIDDAMAAAARTFEAALPRMDAVTMGVRISDYRDALTQRRFTSAFWGKVLDLQLVTNDTEQGLCAGYAAYVTPDIKQGAVLLMVCPQFFSPGADALRETTVLHEMVHVVAGPDECRAMAFTARVQMLATGAFQSVAEYWARNRCDASRYRLPN